ncbi:DUF3857 domain-containing protein [Hymenobacter sp. BT188]|uniref:DUF3858 domain-containing protein n=1 Tax=Hymenobacter sp. BT188 TaxID=2763504 RepID=UPI001651072F|nr:DUF3858 domain-containing protein [Hymenobacter sp. BT188]MBC6607124.1 DUF3857 domain-containing protein [Hymenobacter sp. BT188]
MLSPLGRAVALAMLFFAGGHFCSAQQVPIQFGDVKAADFAPQAKADITAAAEILCDFGQSKIRGGDEGFELVFERTTRLRIHRKAGYTWATVQVPLYHKDGQKEELSGLKGFTYNLVNGQVVKEKLNKEAIFEEKVDANRVRCAFTLPNVREGSIIEYTYVIKSDFLFNLQDWQFQHTIPVRWSEYRAVLPEFFRYKTTERSYFPFDIKEKQAVSYSTIIQWAPKDFDGRSLASSITRREMITGQALQLRWAMKDVPAFREEPYMTTARDYLSSLDFELDGIQYPGQEYQQITSTWDKIASDLLNNEQFGLALSKTTPLTNPATAFVAQYPNSTERLNAALALVQRTVRYNGQGRLYTTATLRRICEQGTGNAAELNLLLINTLRAAGLTAEPLLISTRDHGRIQTDLPVLSQFNYVAALVTLPDNKEVLVDATEPLIMAGTLPERCLNGQGRLMDKTGGRWVSLVPTQRYMRYTTAQLEMTEQGALGGKIKLEHTGYAGSEARELLAGSTEKQFIKNLQQRWPEWTLTAPVFNNVAASQQPFSVEVGVKIPGGEAAATTLYVQPLRHLGEGQNPFRQEDRQFPVDFGMLRDYTQTIALTLPAGYEVQELPANLLLSLPNDGGRFQFNITPQQNTLHITSRLQLRKTEYSAQEYTALRELYSRVVAKHAESIVLKHK